ncbi:hypothetical protein RHSIM_Rhsim08G0183200 [Rhododendron simsii]|uniref:C3H1-type domain-containing protein n=1 Tax=Rhododendron simsii TaxID=118357 RepID=A0A834LHS6_RHOSS|nr:hypothetical protein RHSIM_Rhsim08G0183200 [Rhododendron simsii]
MVSNTSANKAPQKKAAPATEKRGGKAAVAAATVDDAAKRAAKKKADDLAKKAVKKKADDVAKKTAQKKADGVVKKAAVAAKKRARKPMVAAAPFKAAATVDDMAKKVAAATAKRVGKAVAAAASFKAAATVFYMADGGYTRQIPDQTSTGVHSCHPMSRDIQVIYRIQLIPAKENMWEKEENTEKPGLVQCKVVTLMAILILNCYLKGYAFIFQISSVQGKYNRCRRKIPVPPIASNFLGLPIRPGKKDCSYYMLNGVCMYESNCRFNHPDPTPMEGGDAPSVCGSDGSGPSQGAFQPTVVSSSPPRTANETITFGSVVFSPTHKVPPSNVEWDGYQNTTIMETPQPHRSPTTAVVAPLPTTTSSSPPELSTTTDSRLSASPTTADGTPLTSPILVKEDDPKLVKASRYRILCEKMENLCARSCELKAAFEFVNTTMDYMCAEVDKMFLEEGDSIDEGIEQLEVLDPEFLQVNGLKKRVKLRRVGHRLRKKVISKPTRPGQATRA